MPGKHENTGVQYGQQDALFDLGHPRIEPEQLERLRVQIAEAPTLEDMVPLIRRSRRLHAAAARLATNAGQGDTEIEPATKAAEQADKTDSTGPGTKRERVSFKGGAFVSGLQRWIDRYQTDTDKFPNDPTPHDLALLHPVSIMRQLRPAGDRLVYDGVLLTAKDYKRITFSPRSLSNRIDAQVMDKNDGRTPTELNERSTELRSQALDKRLEAVTAAITDAEADVKIAERLHGEMEITRHAHMTAGAMDELLAQNAKRFHDMLRAITQNHSLPTERVESLQAGLDYLLANPDKSRANYYWIDINEVYRSWVDQKLTIFQGVKQRIDAQAQAISDDSTV